MENRNSQATAVNTKWRLSGAKTINPGLFIRGRQLCGQTNHISHFSSQQDSCIFGGHLHKHMSMVIFHLSNMKMVTI